jgi:glycosyltransferase involved in cell wall biosynthesis
MIRILCVHQGYELYGSDRMFILSLKSFRQRYPDGHIVVHIPRIGELYDYILKENLADDLIVETMGVLRKSDLKRLRLKNLILPLLFLRKKIKFCNEFNIIYVNSIVVFEYLLACKFVTAIKIVHVHEMTTGLARWLFNNLIQISGCFSIFISNAVKENFPMISFGEIVHNGNTGFPQCERKFEGVLKILVIGRINSWKGQDFFVKAIAGFSPMVKEKLNVRIVGNVFEDQFCYLDKLKELVCKFEMERIISFYDFDSDPVMHYHWADVVVVPSKLPEPFGLVAIEAMSTGAIVLAANHGGLSEIFVDGTSGVYFEPNNECDLRKELTSLLNDTEKIRLLSRNSRERYLQNFTEEAYINRFISVLEKLSN